jgi:hypothetical protein
VAEPETDDVVSLRALFEGIANDAGDDVTTLQAIRTRRDARDSKVVSSSHPSFRAASAMGGAETGDPSLPVRFDSQEQELLQIRDNAKHICALLDQMNRQPAQPRDGSRSLSEASKGGLQDLEWEPRSIMQIRKLWEVRPKDVILMRTVIGIDGDVIAHVNPAFSGQEFSYLHRLHDQCVEVSVGFWKELIGILSDFVTIVVDKVFR